MNHPVCLLVGVVCFVAAGALSTPLYLTTPPRSPAAGRTTTMSLAAWEPSGGGVGAGGAGSGDMGTPGSIAALLMTPGEVMLAHVCACGRAEAGEEAWVCA